MRRVAERVGIRAPSIYKHLPDKQALEAARRLGAASRSGPRCSTAGDAAEALGRAYRAYALRPPAPLPADDRAAARRATGSPPASRSAPRARSSTRSAATPTPRGPLWAFAHGMTILELNGRFPPGADLDAAWATGMRAFRR